MTSQVVHHEPEASMQQTQPEPWLRNTRTDIDPVRRAVIHALDLAAEDATHYTIDLTRDQLFARPVDLPPIAFHLRHIARSLDRLLTYAEGRQLNADQLAALKAELDPDTTADPRLELRAALNRSVDRIRVLPPDNFADLRSVGRRHLPTTVGSLLVHCADHTQRHVGQIVTTAKLLLATRQ